MPPLHVRQAPVLYLHPPRRAANNTTAWQASNPPKSATTHKTPWRASSRDDCREARQTSKMMDQRGKAKQERTAHRRWRPKPPSPKWQQAANGAIKPSGRQNKWQRIADRTPAATTTIHPGAWQAKRSATAAHSHLMLQPPSHTDGHRAWLVTEVMYAPFVAPSHRRRPPRHCDRVPNEGVVRSAWHTICSLEEHAHTSDSLQAFACQANPAQPLCMYSCRGRRGHRRRHPDGRPRPEGTTRVATALLARVKLMGLTNSMSARVQRYRPT